MRQRASEAPLARQLVRALVVLAIGPAFACRSVSTTAEPECGKPTAPSIPSHHTIRQGAVIDTAYARSGIARLVFRVRSAGPDPGKPLATTPLVYLQDSLADNRVQLRRIGDSAGVAVLDSVSPRYSSARVLSIAYVSHTFPIAVRRGYTDTIDVALAEARLCLM